MPTPRTVSTRSDALEFLQEYCEFTGERLYVLELSARGKENEGFTQQSLPNFTRVIRSERTLRNAYQELCALLDAYELPSGETPNFRIYISVNARDSQKGFYAFQKELLQLNKGLASDDIGATARIQQLDEEWKSTIHSPEQRLDKRFLFDIDTTDSSVFQSFHTELCTETQVIETMKTPNGYHIVTEKFNYTDFSPLAEREEIELKHDAALYVYRDPS